MRRRKPRWVVLQCEAITDIDVTAADMLEALDHELNDQGVHLAFVELRDRLQELVERYGLNETLDREHFYPSIDVALADIARHRRRPRPRREHDDVSGQQPSVRKPVSIRLDVA